MDAGDPSPDKRAELELTELTVAGRGVRMVGVPIGTDEPKNMTFIAEVVATGEAAKLMLRMLVKIGGGAGQLADYAAASASTGLTFLLRTLPPSSIPHDAEDFEALLEWALASTIAGEEADKVRFCEP